MLKDITITEYENRKIETSETKLKRAAGNFVLINKIEQFKLLFTWVLVAK